MDTKEHSEDKISLKRYNEAISLIAKYKRQEGKEDGELPKFRKWVDLKVTKLPPLKLIIDGVLNSGAKMTVGGDSKAGKTWILMDLAQSISRGTAWLGLNTYKGRVLYVDFELQEQKFQDRMNYIEWKRGYKEPPADLVTWNLRGYRLTAEEFKDAILNQIGAEQFDVIVLDPLYKILAGADANAAGDMQMILGNIEAITRKTGAAIVYGDHFAKGNSAMKKAIDRISGSGVNARDPDAIVTFTENEIGGAMSVEFQLRNFKPLDKFAVAKEKDSPLFERRDDIDPTRLAGMPGQKPQYDGKQIISYLPDEGSLETEEWFNRAKTATGISEPTFKRIRSDLRKNGHAVNSTIDGKSMWMKTAKGMILQGGVVVEDEGVTADEDPFA
jgi:hypothetical protein